MLLNLMGGDFQFITFSGWDGSEKYGKGESNCKGLQREDLVKVEAGSTGLFHQAYMWKWKRCKA